MDVKHLRTRQWVTFGIGLFVLYFMLMAIRWSGDVEGLTAERFAEVVLNVLEAGFEREMASQASAVFNWYFAHQEWIYGLSYAYFPLQFYEWLDPSFALDNPMYFYYEIVSGVNSGLLRGSAHPSVFVDAFANFGAAGIFVPGLLALLLSSKPFRNESVIEYPFYFVGILILARGSVANAVLFFGYGFLIYFIRSVIAARQ